MNKEDLTSGEKRKMLDELMDKRNKLNDKSSSSYSNGEAL